MIGLLVLLRTLHWENGMRQRNWRLIIVGIIMILAAGAFFFGMGTTAPRSSDPVALMQTVGQVSGAVGGLGLVMLAYGLAVGRKA
jgi:vacuolar-type H+-ATPase subunit I/STV1